MEWFIVGKTGGGKVHKVSPQNVSSTKGPTAADQFSEIVAEEIRVTTKEGKEVTALLVSPSDFKKLKDSKMTGHVATVTDTDDRKIYLYLMRGGVASVTVGKFDRPT